MPSPRYDVLIQLFHDHPQLAVEILRDLMAVDLPFATPARLDPYDGTLALTLGPPRSPAHAIIVEIPQDTTRTAERLARDAAALWLRLDCDVTVLLVCPDHEIAAHYARPITSGLTGYHFQAQVLGPHGIPDSDLHSPEMWHLEEIMTSATWLAHSPFTRGLEEGRTAGRKEMAARILLLVLATRGLDVPDDTRTRIVSGADLAQLRTWVTRAATAKSVEDVFDEPVA
ncbi:hypothetical protein [Nonomuraea sp. KM90]|uniref:hypothetical protein n=1 Tax=Nonomuraea sp. KM90 TaxID=3457428 RepID=UPI003FCE7F81